MRRRSTSIIIVLAGLASAVVPTAAQAAPTFTCEASALRGTLLGTPIEPVVFGRGQECRTGQTVPTVSLPELLDASVFVAAGNKSDDALKPAASAGCKPKKPSRSTAVSPLVPLPGWAMAILGRYS